MKVWKFFKSIISSLALFVSGTILTVLFAIGVLIGGIALAVIALISGLSLVILGATLPTSKLNDWVEEAKRNGYL